MVLMRGEIKVRNRHRLNNVAYDDVVQGLSEVPFMSDVTHWGVLTIGTGLGNARFTMRSHSRKE
jgi:hypothetical protein